MFYEKDITSDSGSLEAGLPSSSAESATRHLINRLRLEFRTASQRQLEDAVSAAINTATSHSTEKILQLARASLEQLLKPGLERSLEEPSNSEPPFRTET
ncbi:MAG: hypothetical protein QM760_04825 [Nibricoccus sp.]